MNPVDNNKKNKTNNDKANNGKANDKAKAKANDNDNDDKTNNARHQVRRQPVRAVEHRQSADRVDQAPDFHRSPR